jgi:hypothetical protein
MEAAASMADLCRVLGQPVSELHDIGYCRLRWSCGCIAKGISSQSMLAQPNGNRRREES